MTNIMTEEERLHQGWLERRRKGVGASESPILVLGEHFQKTPVDLYMAKMGLSEDTIETKDMRRGTALETHALDEFRRDTGVDVRGTQTLEEKYGKDSEFAVRHPVHSFIYAHLDGIIGDGKTEIVEVKCPRVGGFMKIKEEGLPEGYQIQGQHQMAVTGAQVCHFVIFSAELWEYRHIPLERDEQMVELIVARAARFWLDHVLEEKAPEQKVRPEDIPNIRKKGGVSRDVAESGAWKEAFGIYRNADMAHKAAKKEIDEAKGLVLGLMEATSNFSVHIGRDKFSYAQVAGRKTFDKKALKLAHPDIDLSGFDKMGKPYKKFSASLKEEVKSDGK